MSQITPIAAPVYDAVSVLGFGPPSPAPLVEAQPGEMVLRYGGWSLRDLRDNPLIRRTDLMLLQDWYRRHGWSAEELPSGVYVLRMPVARSNRKTFNQQKVLLLPGEEAAPAVLAASALLVHQIETGQRLLAGQWLRCRERTVTGHRVELRWHGRRLRVFADGEDEPINNVWLASARTLPA